MRTFQISKNIEIVCRSEGTRYGFRHLATLLYNGYERGTSKICYYNRTWERYEFESVLEKVAEDHKKLLDEKEYKKVVKSIKNFN